MLALELGASVKKLAAIVKGHPTLSEVTKKSALDCEGIRRAGKRVKPLASSGKK